MIDKVFRHNTSEYLKKSLKRKECYFSKCNKKPIKSHTFQKNEILKKLSDEKGNVYGLVEPELVKKEVYSFFKKVSINTATTFEGFCAEHDTEIFKSFEILNECDILEYIFLNAYRGFAYAHNLEMPIYNDEYNVIDTKYYKKQIKDNPKISIKNKKIYENSHIGSKRVLRSTYDIDNYKKLKNKYEKIIKIENTEIRLKLIKKRFAIFYIEIPFEVNWASLAAAQYGNVKNSLPISIGLIPANKNNEAIFYFVVLKKEEAYYNEIIGELTRMKNMNCVVNDKNSCLYTLIQNLLLLTSGNIVLSSNLYNKLKDKKELERLNKFYFETTMSRYIDRGEKEFEISTHNGYNLFNTDCNVK